MERKIIKIGKNSMGLNLPKAVKEIYGWRIGDTLTLIPNKDQTLTIRKTEPNPFDEYARK
jgi:antitoxin component of MazEF toxin-antitoxin module